MWPFSQLKGWILDRVYGRAAWRSERIGFDWWEYAEVTARGDKVCIEQRLHGGEIHVSQIDAVGAEKLGMSLLAAAEAVKRRYKAPPA